MSHQSKQELENFRKGIEIMIRIDSPAAINNTNADHAKIILEAMFAAVTTSAFVFCGHVAPDVWGSETMARNIEMAILRGVDVKFIVERPGDLPTADDSPTVAALRRNPGVLVASDGIPGWNRHFAVFDSKRFRVETNHENKTAIACANNPEIAQGLERIAKAMLKPDRSIT